MLSEEQRLNNPQNWKFLGTLLWGIVALAVTDIGSSVFAVLIQAPNYLPATLEAMFKGSSHDGRRLSLSAIAVMFFGCLILVAIIKLKKNSNLFDYLAFKPISTNSLLKWIGVLLAYIAFTEVVGFLLGRPVVNAFMSESYKTASPVWLLWVALIFAAPIFEELFFRGFLFKGFVSSFLGSIGSIVCIAFVWAAIHIQYDIYDIGTIFFMGILLGLARLRTGSILVPMGMHAVSNLIATLEVAFL
jgi:membrane protease YdiL (CAAX protease family)